MEYSDRIEMVYCRWMKCGRLIVIVLLLQTDVPVSVLLNAYEDKTFDYVRDLSLMIIIRGE